MNLRIENLSGFQNPAGNSVEQIRETRQAPQQSSTETAQSGGEKSFLQLLEDSVTQVNEYQGQADTAVKELVAGKSKNIHETLLAVERADTSLKLMMQVRNKILDAYREIMKMQV